MFFKVYFLLAILGQSGLKAVDHLPVTNQPLEQPILSSKQQDCLCAAGLCVGGYCCLKIQTLKFLADYSFMCGAGFACYALEHWRDKIE